MSPFIRLLINDRAITVGRPNCSLIVFRAVAYIVPFDPKPEIALSLCIIGSMHLLLNHSDIVGNIGFIMDVDLESVDKICITQWISRELAWNDVWYISVRFQLDECIFNRNLSLSNFRCYLGFFKFRQFIDPRIETRCFPSKTTFDRGALLLVLFRGTWGRSINFLGRSLSRYGQ